MTTQATPRDVTFVAECAGTEGFPITIHLGHNLAITSWLFRKPKYWVDELPTQLTIEELEQILTQRASSIDPLRSAVSDVQQAVTALALSLNAADDAVVLATADELADRSPVDAATLTEIDARISLGS